MSAGSSGRCDPRARRSSIPKVPAIRPTEDDIEIDQKKGEWPFIHVARTEKGGLVITIDDEVAPMIGERHQIRLSKKKSDALLIWLVETHPEAVVE